MGLDKPYRDIPGTTIFDAELSRLGYHLNQFCMSLMKAENRARFKADERAYLDEWPMTEEQKQGVLTRDLNRCLAAGGNIYFLAKIGATDGRSFQYMAASMTGMTQEAYAAQVLAVVNLGLIQKFIDAGKLSIAETITEEALVAAGLTNHKRDGIRILAKGEITAKIALAVSGASKPAVEAVEKAGGTIAFVVMPKTEAAAE